MCKHYVRKFGVSKRMIYVCMDGRRATLSITARSDAGQGASCDMTRDELARLIDELQGVLDSIDINEVTGNEDDDY